MSRRKLRPEERELWQKVTHSATPLPQALRRAVEPQKPTIQRNTDAKQIDLPTAFGIGTKSDQPKNLDYTSDGVAFKASHGHKDLRKDEARQTCA